MRPGAEPVTGVTTGETRFSAASRMVRAVADGAGLSAREDEILDCLSVLTQSWGESRQAASLPWSGLGADASGCDASLVVDGERRELRITAEAQGHPASPPSYWRAALQLSSTLEALYGADISALRAVQDLWTELDSNAPGVLWHGAVFRDDQPPWFKLYLHLNACGRGRIDSLAEAAMTRLARDAAWDHLMARKSPGDQWLFLSLDMLPASSARVKLYLRHGQTDARHLGRIAASLNAEHGRQVESFVSTLIGRAGSLIRRGALTTFQIEPGRTEPSRITTHLRLYPHCTTSDAVMAGRMRRALAELGIAADRYERALDALAPQGLANQEALHGWASLQWDRGRPSVSIYVSPRIHFASHGPIALDPERMWPSPLPLPLAAAAPACASL